MYKECLPNKGWKILYGLKDMLAKYRATLAGGTALALHLGHRISIDLDFFTDVNFKVESIISEIRKKGYPFRIISEAESNPDPEYIKGKELSWDNVKKFFKHHVKQFVFDLDMAVKEYK